MSVPELSIQIVNVPGQLSQLTAILAEANIRILALTASSIGKNGWVRLVTNNSKMAAEALEDCGYLVEVGEALAVIASCDDSDLFDRVFRELSDQKINVDYIYTSVCGDRNEKIVIIGVKSPGKAEKILKAAGIQLATIED